MMETDNPFEKVLDRLREKGWMKGNYGLSAGPNCIVGAHMFVTGSDPYTSYHSAFRTVLEPIILDQHGSYHDTKTPIPAFNDHPDTTFTDVERVLEKAAIKWEEERVMRDD